MSLKSLSPWDMGAQRITNLATPTSSSDAATRAYVDGAGLGRWRGSWASVVQTTPTVLPADGLGAYVTADIVTYQGTTYRATTTPTMGEPPLNSLEWTVLAQAGANGANGTSGVSFTFQGSWDDGTPYLIGQWVEYSGSLYYCTGNVANTATPPPSDAIGWQLGMTGGAAPAGTLISGMAPQIPVKAGHYLIPHANSVGNTSSHTVGWGSAAPFWVASNTTADRIALYVNTPTSLAYWRLGIYLDNGAGYPGALHLDAGQIDGRPAADGGAAAGLRELTISATLNRGWYWTVACAQGAYAAARGNVGPVYGVLPNSANSSGDLAAGYQGNLGSGALPGSFPTTVTMINSPARVAVRVTG